jgi:hypothetical protein
MKAFIAQGRQPWGGPWQLPSGGLPPGGNVVGPDGVVQRCAGVAGAAAAAAVGVGLADGLAAGPRPAPRPRTAGEIAAGAGDDEERGQAQGEGRGEGERRRPHGSSRIGSTVTAPDVEVHAGHRVRQVAVVTASVAAFPPRPGGQ